MTDIISAVTKGLQYVKMRKAVAADVREGEFTLAKAVEENKKLSVMFCFYNGLIVFLILCWAYKTVSFARFSAWLGYYAVNLSVLCYNWAAAHGYDSLCGWCIQIFSGWEALRMI